MSNCVAFSHLIRASSSIPYSALILNTKGLSELSCPRLDEGEPCNHHLGKVENLVICRPVTKACPLDSSATVWCGCVPPHPDAKIHLQRIHRKRPTVMAEAFAEENLCWWPSFADSCWQTMVCELFKQDYAMLYGEFLWHKALLIDSGVSVSCERFCKYMRT